LKSPADSLACCLRAEGEPQADREARHLNRPVQPDLVAIGRIRGAVGVRGEVRVESFSSFPDRWGEENGLQILFIGRDEASAEMVRVASCRTSSGSLIVHFESAGSRDAAERLRGAYLYIEASALHPLSEGEYFIHDLIGMEVIDAAGSARGRVADVLTTPANGVLLVRDAGREHAIPFIHDAVELVDPLRRMIRLKALEGMFED